MNLKYYLRGLGIGILVTALIMGVAADRHEKKMSDDEIRREAVKLGMVDGTEVLSDQEDGDSISANDTGTAEAETEKEVLNPEIEKEQELEAVDPESVSAQETDIPEAVDKSGQDTEISDPENTIGQKTGREDVDPEEADERQTQDKPTPEEDSRQGGSVTVTVQSGDGSNRVAAKLEQAGLVESAKDFDRFLCSNGYDKRLRVGSYEIPVGAENVQIAKILTGR